MNPPPVDPDTPRAPPTLGELFRACSSVGLSGFGGVLPLLRHMLVDERRLMDGKDFNALLGLCQFLPGSNVVNLAVCVGARFHGARGAIVATAGLLLGPFFVMMMLATAYGLWGASSGRAGHAARHRRRRRGGCCSRPH